MTRYRNKIHASIPEPNDNVTMTMGNKTVVDAVFADTGLDVFLDGLKRSQGNSVAAETAALVANSVEMTGISVNRIDRILEEDVIRAEYGLDANAPRSVYRTVERLGENSDAIVKYLGGVLKKKYGVKMDTVFMDWTSLFFEAPQQGIVRVGYSRDHRPQVTIGLSMDRESGMPVGLTVNAGNILDVTHFEDTFGQIRHLLPEDAMIVFDNGAYSRKNSALLDKEGVGFVTRLQLNTSDDKFVDKHKGEWVRIDDILSYQLIKGNLKRRRYIFRNEKLRSDVMERYRRKAERDWEEMEIIRKNIDIGKKPRKKYRNSNCFVDTKLSYMFPLDCFSKEEAIDHAVARMITGREGLFVLLTNRPLTAEKVIELYRARNQVESAFSVNSAHLSEFPRFRHSSRWYSARNGGIPSVDEVIRIESECFNHPHEQFLMFRRTVKILFITLAHQIHRIDFTGYALHRQIDVVLLQHMSDNIRDHCSDGYHEHHRILPRRPVDVHPVDPHAVLHESEGML